MFKISGKQIIYFFIDGVSIGNNLVGGGNYLREVLEREVGFITEGVDVVENMILRRSFRRVSTAKVFIKGLDSSVVDVDNQ